MTKPGPNEFFDINKLPADWGILVFPISISLITTSQNPKKCLEHIRNFSPDKINTPKVGANFVYGDFLYLHSDNKASELKHRFMNLVVDHKNALQRLVAKNHQDFQIQHSFNYETWNQMYLGVNNFPEKLQELINLFGKDKLFQKYLKEDADRYGRGLDENQINFFLEEHLLQYLLLHQKIRLRNDYVQDREKWVLWAYPGVPPKALVYLLQLNPFDLETDNPYGMAEYNLENNKLYEFDRLDLETWNYE